MNQQIANVRSTVDFVSPSELSLADAEELRSIARQLEELASGRIAAMAASPEAVAAAAAGRPWRSAFTADPLDQALSPEARRAVAGLSARQQEIVAEHVRDESELSIAELLALFEERYFEEEDSDRGLAEEFAQIGVALQAVQR